MLDDVSFKVSALKRFRLEALRGKPALWQWSATHSLLPLDAMSNVEAMGAECHLNVDFTIMGLEEMSFTRSTGSPTVEPGERPYK